MRELKIGEMAELNCLSEKTLRLYQEMGLLIPKWVDEHTGYRHYSLDQCATLDLIQQLKTLGCSLEQIKTILDHKDVNYLSHVIDEQHARLIEEIHRLSISKRIAEDVMRNCEIFQHKPVCDEIEVQHLPERHILRLGIPAFTVDEPTTAEKALETWELCLRHVKRQMIERHYPLSLFRNVGCIVSKENLMNRNCCFDRAFVVVNGSLEDVSEDAEIVPEGDFLTMSCDGIVDSQGNYRETSALLRMLDVIDEKGYRITGDYLGEIMFESPAFFYNGRDMMFRLEIPIDTQVDQTR